MPNEQLQEDINLRNFEQRNTKCKVITTYKSGKNRSAIISVPSSTYIELKTEGTIYVGTQRCKIFDNINLKPCFNFKL